MKDDYKKDDYKFFKDDHDPLKDNYKILGDDLWNNNDFWDMYKHLKEFMEANSKNRFLPTALVFGLALWIVNTHDDVNYHIELLKECVEDIKAEFEMQKHQKEMSS